MWGLSSAVIPGRILFSADDDVSETLSWDWTPVVVLLLVPRVPSPMTLISTDHTPQGAGDGPAVSSDLCPE